MRHARATRWRMLAVTTVAASVLACSVNCLAGQSVAMQGASPAGAGAEAATWAANLADVHKSWEPFEFHWKVPLPSGYAASARRLPSLVRGRIATGGTSSTPVIDHLLTRLQNANGVVDVECAFVDHLRDVGLPHRGDEEASLAMHMLLRLHSTTALGAIAEAHDRFRRGRENAAFVPNLTGIHTRRLARDGRIRRWRLHINWGGCSAHWVARTPADGTWVTPLFVRGPYRDVITVEDGRVDFTTHDGGVVSVDVAVCRADDDADGLTDLLEQYLGTDPSRPDSDGDGITDGRDGNPLTPRRPLTSDAEHIRAAAAFVVLASWTSGLLYVSHTDGSPPQEYDGCPSILLPAKREPGREPRLIVDVKRIGATRAVVTFHLPHQRRSAHVELIGGAWAMVRGMTTLISQADFAVSL